MVLCCILRLYNYLLPFSFFSFMLSFLLASFFPFPSVSLFLWFVVFFILLFSSFLFCSCFSFALWFISLSFSLSFCPLLFSFVIDAEIFTLSTPCGYKQTLQTLTFKFSESSLPSKQSSGSVTYKLHTASMVLSHVVITHY